MLLVKDTLKTIIFALVAIIFIGVAYAWVEPSVSPPNPSPNIYSPINIGPDTQYKAGLLSAEHLKVYNTAVFDGSVSATDFCTSSGKCLKDVYIPGSQIFSTSGTYSFTVPDGVKTINAEVWGGGGGGGFGPFSMNYKGQHLSTAGGSGGGGGYSRTDGITVTPGEKLNVVVGSGGSAGSATGLYFGSTSITTGGTGGKSWLSRGFTMLLGANGGAGGVSHDYHCTGGSCNGTLSCASNVAAVGGASGTGTEVYSGGNGIGCLDDGDVWGTSGGAYYIINSGGKSGKVTDHLGGATSVGTGGNGTHNRNTSNTAGQPGQVIIWW